MSSAITRVAIAAALLSACGDDATAPQPVLGWAAIEADGGSTCAITTTQAAFCWGRSADGQLGVGAAPESLLTPTAVAGALDLDAIAVTNFHGCGVTSNGAGYCWGSGVFGRLGTGNSASTTAPTPMAGGHQFTAIDVETQARLGGHRAPRGAYSCT